MRQTVTLDLQADDVDGFAMRRLAQVLKALLRQHGWRCTRIAHAANAEALRCTDATQTPPDGMDAPGCEPCGKIKVSALIGSFRGG